MWLATKRNVKGTGRDYYVRTSGYYTTYEGLLDGYVRERGKTIVGDDVQNLLSNLADVEKEVRSLARKLGKEIDNKE